MTHRCVYRNRCRMGRRDRRRRRSRKKKMRIRSRRQRIRKRRKRTRRMSIMESWVDQSKYCSKSDQG